MKRTGLILFAAIVFQACSHAGAPERLTTKNCKGVELYSWRDVASDAWCFTMLPGTNRVKLQSEITNPRRTIKSVGELKLRLGHLAVGEYVMWTSIDPKKAYPLLPPKRITDEIAETARDLQLNLYIPKP